MSARLVGIAILTGVACSGASTTTRTITTVTRTRPAPAAAVVVPPPPPPPVRVLSSTASGICVLDATHTLLCSDGTGPFAAQLGVPALAGLASGAPCGWTASGEAWCWTLDAAKRIATLADVTELAGSIDYACARRTAGRITCWALGGSRPGSLGTAAAGSDSLEAMVGRLDGEPTSPTAAIQIAPDRDHACTIDPDGVRCWGLAPITVPIRVANTAGAVQVVAGRVDCAALADQRLACWSATGAAVVDGVVLAPYVTTP